MAWETFNITIVAKSLPGEGVGEVSQADATPTKWPPFPPYPDYPDLPPLPPLPARKMRIPYGDIPYFELVDYDPDWVYIENEWVDIEGVFAVAGGGRWNNQIVFVGKDTIYFEEIS